jgi:hypothetical protein
MGWSMLTSSGTCSGSAKRRDGREYEIRHRSTVAVAGADRVRPDPAE